MIHINFTYTHKIWESRVGEGKPETGRKYLQKMYSWPSVSMGSWFMDSTNCGSNIFGKNFSLENIAVYVALLSHLEYDVSKELRDLVDMIRFVTKLNIRCFLDLDL